MALPFSTHVGREVLLGIKEGCGPAKWVSEGAGEERGNSYSHLEAHDNPQNKCGGHENCEPTEIGCGDLLGPVQAEKSSCDRGDEA